MQKVWDCDTSFALGNLSEDVKTKIVCDADLLVSGFYTFTARWDMERCIDKVSFPKGIDWEYRHQGDPEWLFQLNRHTWLLDLAKAYLLTKKEAYLTCLVDLLGNWIDSCPLTEGSEQTTWRSLEAGIRIDNWVHSLALLGSSLPETLVKKMGASLFVHGNYLARKHGVF
jgi:hypothetical protein